MFDLASGYWTGSEVLNEIFGLAEPGLARDAAAWLEIVHPDDRETMRHYLFKEVLKKGTPFDRIYRIIRLNDEQERWVHGLGKLVRNDHGQITRMVGIIQDITERKQNEDRLNVQTSALTAAANGIIITGRDGRIEWVNPAFTKLTGYSAEEVDWPEPPPAEFRRAFARPSMPTCGAAWSPAMSGMGNWSTGEKTASFTPST